jgi:death-on-curing protein
MIYLTPEQILFLHARLVAETGGAQGIRDLGLLISAVDRPKAAYEGSELYPGVLTKAAALMHSLIQNHPFVDGNKRTGIAAAGILLQLNGYRLTATNEELESFTMSAARGLEEVPEIASWLEEHSMKIEAGENNS